MKAYFYWSDCDLALDSIDYNDEDEPFVLIDNNRSSRVVFWVGATREEVEQHIRKRMGKFNAVFDSILKDPVRIEDECMDGKFYFMVPIFKKDLVAPWFRIYPYSGMWGPSNPWQALGPNKEFEPEGVELQSIDQDELINLERKVRYGSYIKFKEDRDDE